MSCMIVAEGRLESAASVEGEGRSWAQVRSVIAFPPCAQHARAAVIGRCAACAVAGLVASGQWAGFGDYAWLFCEGTAAVRRGHCQLGVDLQRCSGGRGAS